MYDEFRFEMHFALRYDDFSNLLFVAFRSTVTQHESQYSCVNIASHTRSIIVTTYRRYPVSLK